MPGRLRTRLFAGLGDFSMRHPWVVVGTLATLLVVGLWLGTLLEIKTSRYSMVRPEDPEQQRLDVFFERFGLPDGLVVVVSGGEESERRAMVDVLRDGYEATPRFSGRVLARIDGKQTAESLMLFEPDVLGEIASMFGAPGELGATLQGGIPSMLRAVESRLESSLDDDDAGADSKEVDEGLRRLELAANLLASELGDEDAWDPSIGFSEFAGGGGDDEAWSVLEGIDDAGYLVGRRSPIHVVALFPVFPGSEVADYAPVASAATDVRDAVLAAHPNDHLTVELTGLPMLTADEHRLVGRGVFESGVATALGVFLMLTLAFRSLRQSVVTLLPLGVSMGIAVGVAYLVIGHLNAVTSGLFAVLLGLGIDFGVHLTARYHEELRNNPGARAAAMRSALVYAGPGILTGAITTSLAFLTVASARFTAYAELGLLTAIGLFVVLACTLLLLPVLATGKWIPEASPPRLFGVHGLPAIVRRAPRLIVVTAVLAAGAGAFSLPMARFNARYLDFMPEEEESARALDLLERDGGLSPIIAFLGADNIEDARQKSAALRDLAPVGEVVSASDVLPDLLEDNRLERLRGALAKAGPPPDFARLAARGNRTSKELERSARGVADILDEIIFALEQGNRDTASAERCKSAFLRVAKVAFSLPPDGGEALATLEDRLANLLGRAWTTALSVAERGAYASGDLPLMFRRRHAARDGTEAVAIFVTPQDPIWEPGPAKEFADAVRSVDAGASGQAINMHVHTQMVQQDFRRAALLAGVLVFLVLLLDFRNLKDAVLAMVPVGLGWGLMVGCMVVFDIALNLANIVVLPLLLGIGIDAGVHIMHRCRQSAAGAPDGRASLPELLEGTGAAVVVATVTTMIGFAGLIIPDHGGMRSLGIVMVIGTGTCLLTSVFALPALLVWLRRAR